MSHVGSVLEEEGEGGRVFVFGGEGKRGSGLGWRELHFEVRGRRTRRL